MKFYTTDTVVVPPMPPLASDQVSGLQVLSALRRNAYCAVPPRCLDEPVVKLPIAGQALILSCAPEVIRHVMITQAEDYGKLPFGRRVLSPIVGRDLVVSEGEPWRRQRRAMAPAFTPRNVASMARHIFLSGAEPDRFAYLPFGIGQHVCIGAQLAMAEATLAIALLMQRFTIAIKGDRLVLPVGTLTTRPDHTPAFVLQIRDTGVND
jgi:cytochrome P450